MTYQSDAWGDTPPLKVDGRKLWAGAVATALVAALVGVVGVLAITHLLGVDILGGRGRVVSNSIVFVPLVAALATIACTALLHVLVLTTPRPRLFFGAICTTVIVLLMLLVFLLPGGQLEAKVATALLYAIIGIVILSLLSGVARTAIRYDTAGPAQGTTQAIRPDYP